MTPADRIRKAPAESGVVNACLAALVLVGFCSLVGGLYGVLLGTSAVHQILTACYFLTFALCVAAIAIVNAIRGAARTPRES
jgi:hypothetical protein